MVKLSQVITDTQERGDNYMTKLRKASISTAIALTITLISMFFQGTSALAARSAATSPTLSVSSNLANRRYVAAGDRAYDMGSEEGRYPAMGFHTRGEMGGIWTPPIKLLDGIWFGINGQWIGPATSFTSGFGYVQMALPTTGTNRLSITRTDFVPDGRRAVEFGLTLTASNSAPFTLNVDAHSELMDAYPWGFTTPDQTQFNLPDTASFNGNQLVFREVGTPPVANATPHDWAALVGATGLWENQHRFPRSAGSAGHLPGWLTARPIPVRRHCLRQGRGW
jgi:hypothetical protein